MKCNQFPPYSRRSSNLENKGFSKLRVAIKSFTKHISGEVKCIIEYRKEFEKVQNVLRRV